LRNGAIVGTSREREVELGPKFRLNAGPEFVVGGYVPGAHGVEAIIVGYYKESELITWRGSAMDLCRPQGGKYLRSCSPVVMADCPFVNLPETHKGHWGTGLIAEDMKKYVSVRPEVVAQIEYLERTDSDHLRHSKYIGFRDDKDARRVVKEDAV
jgi:ATP-dependent DNA ligase